MDKIERPLAEVTVRWISAADGGRRSGPPTAPVYLATSVFVEDGDEELLPGWPVTANKLSVMLQPIQVVADDESRCLAGFLVPELAVDHLRVGAEILIMEGPKTVAHAVIENMIPSQCS